MNRLTRKLFDLRLLLMSGILALVSIPALANHHAAGVNHVHLATSHAGEAIKWYVQHFACSAIPDRAKAIDCGGMNIEFLERPSLGGSQGTGVDHISFSYADVSAKMAELEGVGVRGSGVRLQRFGDGSTLETIPGLFEHGFVFDPWGTRIELVEDPATLGFHHIHLKSADPEAVLGWYAQFMGGERAKLKDHADGLRFGQVWLLVDQYPEGRPASTDERAVDHIGFALADLDSAAQEMGEKGVDVHGLMVPENARTQAKRGYLAGPDGVMIAVVEPEWAGVEEVVVSESIIAAAAPFTVPLTPWGEPDLQGIWTGNAAHGIPLEKAEEAPEAASLTAEQAAARRERGTLGSIWGYEREWRDTTLGYVKSAPSTQVSMIVDPANGRMPPMTAKGQALRTAALDARANPKLASGPEDLTTYVRCITRGLPNLMMPSIYNNGLQIVQSPGYVAVTKEMIHETRVVPITDREHLGSDLKQWLGSSRGHWEGDTLVVEVKGFNGRATYQGAGENLTLTERYRRVGPTSLEYTFTVDDPTIWTSSWTGMFNFDLDNDQYDLVEYACHEGNYGMSNILSAARAKERRSNEPAGE
jgi:catechol 2,3-dioxygenase-like lactoylglutathione lyase family enzyme